MSFKQYRLICPLVDVFTSGRRQDTRVPEEEHMQSFDTPGPRLSHNGEESFLKMEAVEFEEDHDDQWWQLSSERGVLH